MSRSFIKSLHEKRLKTWEEAKALADSVAEQKRDFSAEEQETWLRLNSEIDAIDERVKKLQEAEERAKESEETFRALLDQPVAEGRKAPEDKSADEQLRSWLSGASGGRALDIRPTAEERSTDLRTLSKLTAAAGANTVKTSFYNRLIAHLIEVSGMLSIGATILRTATGESIQVPKTTAHSANASIVAEAATLAANEPTFGQVTLDAFKYGFLIQISHELLNDTSIDLTGYLAMQAGRALGNGIGAHLVTGTGTNQPNGVVTASTTGVTGGTGVGGAYTADNLIDLFYSVIYPYRNSPSCAWLMKDASVATLRKIKDAYGEYLWQPALTAGNPDTVLGKPLFTDPAMPAVGLSAKSVAFGDFSQYFIRMVETLRFERSDDFAFSSDLVTFRAILRGDGDVVDTTGAIKVFAGGAS
ncbi:phage major capsid protein [Actinomadura rupiterrae]|uniref:phage major capsid protein n=1 Tax=Actinomadura rupiterrae TaxID=559627 RepID=UPI0020A34AEA|nr:phage major capsid protein [Actinomadura rupiterrae]MCP2339172.1 HK97 family phage major capsid protein [Actinomadura rupiterrae]